MNGIQVKNLVKTYSTQSTDIILNGAKRPSTTRTVLHGVSVDFPAGKLTAILGRSGCGKSTLLRLIDGTKDAPDSGEIVMPEGGRRAEAPLRSLLERRMADAASFGNARGVRNLFEQILVRQAGRLAGQASVNREDLTRITAADVEAVGRANDLEAKER